VQAAALLGAAAFACAGGCDRRGVPPHSVQKVLDAAAASDRAGDPYATSVAAAEARVAADSHAVRALNALAAAYVARARARGTEGDYARAEDALRRSLALQPYRNEPAREQLAAVLNAEHRFAEALRIADSLLVINPRNVSALALHGDALLEHGDLEGARLAFNAMQEIAPGASGLSRLGRLAELIGDAQDARAWLRMCRAEYDESDDTEARAWVRVQLGLMDLKDGNVRAARRSFEEALRFLPAYHLALDGLARTYERQRDVASAAALLDAAIARCPRVDLLERRAALYEREGRRREAEHLRGYALYLLESSYRSGAVGHLRDLALWLLHHGGDPRRALALAREDSTLRGGVYVDDTLAQAYAALGNNHLAVQCAERAVRHNTWDPELIERAVAIERRAGRNAQAEAITRRAKNAWSGSGGSSSETDVRNGQIECASRSIQTRMRQPLKRRAECS
jgi:tetratricopeptide (TPR) repeat protein